MVTLSSSILSLPSVECYPCLRRFSYSIQHSISLYKYLFTKAQLCGQCCRSTSQCLIIRAKLSTVLTAWTVYLGGALQQKCPVNLKKKFHSKKLYLCIFLSFEGSCGNLCAEWLKAFPEKVHLGAILSIVCLRGISAACQLPLLLGPSIYSLNVWNICNLLQ